MAESVYRGYVRGIVGSTQEHQRAFLEQCANEIGMPFKCYVDLENLLGDLQKNDIAAAIDLTILCKEVKESNHIQEKINQKGASFHVGGQHLRLESPLDCLCVSFALDDGSEIYKERNKLINNLMNAKNTVS
jgi:hypothetical protein